MRKRIRCLEGKVAVITGAASGIGRALATHLWEKGCHLAIVDVDEAGLGTLAAQLPKAERTLSVHVADVADGVRMRSLAREVAAAQEQIHVLLNSAGVAHAAPFLQTNLRDWERVIGVNLWGVIHACHFFMPHLAKVDRAHIVNLSSLLGLVGMPGQAAYCATKFALRGLSETLWEELRPTSIGLTLVHPGAVATNIMKTAEGNDPELLARVATWYEQHAMDPASVAARIIRAIEKGKPRLCIGADSVFADAVKRWMPVTGNRAVSELAVRMLGLRDLRDDQAKRWRESMVDGEP
jgi:short-subunit dehydrogenase